MIYRISLFVALLVTWLLLSGHFTPLLLVLGVASCILVLLISVRMDVVDHEGHPSHLGWHIFIYIPWLLWEIVKANIDVAKAVVSMPLNISPTIIRVKASQKTDVGQVIYANSITLTPGTISVNLEDGEIDVHALEQAGADGVADGEMDRRVTDFEGHD